jgi:hypothetical protein
MWLLFPLTVISTVNKALQNFLYNNLLQVCHTHNAAVECVQLGHSKLNFTAIRLQILVESRCANTEIFKLDSVSSISCKFKLFTLSASFTNQNEAYCQYRYRKSCILIVSSGPFSSAAQGK